MSLDNSDIPLPEAVSRYGTANDSEIGPDFYPQPKDAQKLRPWTVIWVDGEGQLVMDHVDALDVHAAQDAARKEHEGDSDAVTGDVIILSGHQWDETLEQGGDAGVCALRPSEHGLPVCRVDPGEPGQRGG